MHPWAACYKESVEHGLNVYGTSHPHMRSHCAILLFGHLKQYEEAIPRYEGALIIHQRVYGDLHDITVRLT